MNIMQKNKPKMTKNEKNEKPKKNTILFIVFHFEII